MADKDTYNSSVNLWDLVNTNLRQASPGQDKGLLSKDGGSFIMKKNGASVQASGIYTQHIVDKNTGAINDYSLKYNTTTVQRNIIANDIGVNNHKLNSQLWELTNMKNVMGTAIGDLTVMGTVLVKTWEPNLKKWVLIRRQVRVPVFSNLLDSYKVDERLNLDDGGDVYKYKIKKVEETNEDKTDTTKKTTDNSTKKTTTKTSTSTKKTSDSTKKSSTSSTKKSSTKNTKKSTSSSTKKKTTSSKKKTTTTYIPNLINNFFSENTKTNRNTKKKNDKKTSTKNKKSGDK